MSYVYNLESRLFLPFNHNSHNNIILSWSFLDWSSPHQMICYFSFHIVDFPSLYSTRWSINHVISLSSLHCSSSNSCVSPPSLVMITVVTANNIQSVLFFLKVFFYFFAIVFLSARNIFLHFELHNWVICLLRCNFLLLLLIW